MAARFLSLVAIAAALAGCQPADSLAVEDAWVRLPAVAGRPGAAYFTVASAEPRVLTGVTTPAAARTELHESMGAGGMMTMRPLAQVPVEAGTPLRFAPGGRHVMLFEVDRALKAGSETRLTLRFADGATIEAPARLVGAGEAAPE